MSVRNSCVDMKIYYICVLYVSSCPFFEFWVISLSPEGIRGTFRQVRYCKTRRNIPWYFKRGHPVVYLLLECNIKVLTIEMTEESHDVSAYGSRQ